MVQNREMITNSINFITIIAIIVTIFDSVVILFAVVLIIVGKFGLRFGYLGIAAFRM
jgi:hypothetical protein